MWKTRPKWCMKQRSVEWLWAVYRLLRKYANKLILFRSFIISCVLHINGINRCFEAPNTTFIMQFHFAMKWKRYFKCLFRLANLSTQIFPQSFGWSIPPKSFLHPDQSIWFIFIQQFNSYKMKNLLYIVT